MSGETFDVGTDTGSPVGPYPHDFKCTAIINGVTLARLNDFILFQLIPERGRWVTGFGKAYDFQGTGFEGAQHLGPQQLSPGG